MGAPCSGVAVTWQHDVCLDERMLSCVGLWLTLNEGAGTIGSYCSLQMANAICLNVGRVVSSSSDLSVWPIAFRCWVSGLELRHISSSSPSGTGTAAFRFVSGTTTAVQYNVVDLEHNRGRVYGSVWPQDPRSMCSEKMQCLYCIKGVTKIYGVWEQAAGENVWIKEG